MILTVKPPHGIVDGRRVENEQAAHVSGDQ